jgi:hypothetical protein
MHNMLSDAIVDAMQGWRFEYGSSTLILFAINVLPETKKYRPGMPLNTLSVEIRCHSDEQITINWSIASQNLGQVLKSGCQNCTWADAKSFFRGTLSLVKAFDFKFRDPFFRVTRDDGHKQIV